MKIIQSAILFFLVSLSTVCTANVTTVHVWEKAIFESGRYRVEVAIDKHHHVSSLKVWISGKLIKIPKEDYQHIAFPELGKITLTHGDSPCLEIPVLVASPEMPNGPFIDGGSWTTCFTNAKYTGMEEPVVP